MLSDWQIRFSPLMDEFDQSITCVGRLLSIPALFTLENSTSAMKHFSLPKSTYELPTTAISSLFQEFWTLANVPWFREMFSWQETFGQLECDSNKGSRIINWWSLNEPFTPLMMFYTYFLVPILTCMLYNLLKCTLHLTTAKTEKMRYDASLRVVHILIHLSICYRFPN